MHGTPVEVRKGPKSTTWYDACILDVKGESITVGFEDHVWPTRDVPAYSVRRCPEEDGTAQDEKAFDPQPEEVVEVRLQATETSPGGWSLGRVRTVKNGFYFIGFLTAQRGSQDVIVERSALRPCSGELPLEAAGLVRRLLSVSGELHSWIRSQDSSGCLSHVQQRAGLLIARCTDCDDLDAADVAAESVEGNIATSLKKPAAKIKARAEAVAGPAPEILLVGESGAVDVAEKLLVQIHFKNQVEMQRFHEMRDKFMERLAEMQEWHSALHKEIFTVDQHLVGKLIGRKGENINQVRDRHGVDIQVQDDVAEGATTITITGNSADVVRRAREELEYVTERMELEPEQVGWILGKGYQNISEIARKTELSYARFDDKGSCLELCGLKSQVEDARMLIRAHTEYLSVYKDMNEEKSAIQQSFEQLDGVAGSRRPARRKGDVPTKAAEAKSLEVAAAGTGQGKGWRQSGAAGGQGSVRKGGGK